MIAHRWRFMAASVFFLAVGAFAMSKLHTAFFPKDLSYLSYVDVWLPEDVPVAATNATRARSKPSCGTQQRNTGKSIPDRTANPGRCWNA